MPPLLVAGCLCLEVARQGFGSSRQETVPLPEWPWWPRFKTGQTCFEACFANFARKPKKHEKDFPRSVLVILDRFIESLCVSIGRPGKCWLLQWCLCAWHYGAVPRRATFPESDFPKSEVVPLIHYINIYIYIYSFALASLWIFTFFTLVSKSGVEVMELVWMAGTASALRNNLSSAWSLRLQMVIVVTSSLPWTSVDIRGPFPLSLLSLPFEHFWRAFFW